MLVVPEISREAELAIQQSNFSSRSIRGNAMRGGDYLQILLVRLRPTCGNSFKKRLTRFEKLSAGENDPIFSPLIEVFFWRKNQAYLILGQCKMPKGNGLASWHTPQPPVSYLPQTCWNRRQNLVEGHAMEGCARKLVEYSVSVTIFKLSMTRRCLETSRTLSFCHVSAQCVVYRRAHRPIGPRKKYELSCLLQQNF